ncbi:hypothetical protein [Ornithinibacillus halophilus]|uniref:Uncharacterized protein n=1 Tax=Ornithinibacillus halophilus TaxID=930117 RepID=A0A1M5MAD6_9BACI|nr:hypothetical protein [Ornithinibacillus halophilus]SHG74252.1 hypothetical protein SAMN05216225_10566 [Ornithinibacillus halophilus]
MSNNEKKTPELETFTLLNPEFNTGENDRSKEEKSSSLPGEQDLTKIDS